MKLHKYSSYNEYVEAQAYGNKANADGQWGKRDEIKFLSDYLNKDRVIKFGLCHGTKQGNEQRWFSEFTGAEVWGTEISDTAEKYPFTIRWDFHEVKGDWRGAMDFIYSNALDHSYAPAKCLAAWMSCLKPDGCCIIEWSTGHTEEKSNNIDPFGATFEEYKTLAELGGFIIKDVLRYKSPEQIHEKTYLIVQR